MREPVNEERFWAALKEQLQTRNIISGLHGGPVRKAAGELGIDLLDISRTQDTSSLVGEDGFSHLRQLRKSLDTLITNYDASAPQRSVDDELRLAKGVQTLIYKHQAKIVACPGLFNQFRACINAWVEKITGLSNFFGKAREHDLAPAFKAAKEKFNDMQDTPILSDEERARYSDPNHRNFK